MVTICENLFTIIFVYNTVDEITGITLPFSANMGVTINIETHTEKSQSNMKR
jgi:hypothetical protein